MDSPADKYASDDNHRSDPFLAIAQTMREFVSRLVGFFTVTEEERLKAGIYFRGEGHDE